MVTTEFLTLGLSSQVLVALGVLAGAAAVGFVVYRVGFAFLRRVSRGAVSGLDDSLARHGRWPLRWLGPVLMVHLALPAVEPDLPDSPARWLDVALRIVLPILFGWVLVASVRMFEDVAVGRVDLQVRDNVEARRMVTRVRVLKRIALVVIVLLTLAVVLLSFERLRQIGQGLLASAGLAGIILGFSAQSILSNLLAGFQIAIAQPVRIGDVVVVEGEWGRIEEITLTYVVIRIWDERRLVLPIRYFIEEPFENWTRTSSHLLATVYFHADYRVPVGAVRRELHRILEQSELWDGESWGLQVTGAGESTLELRAVMSVADSVTAWDLRCLVRERLIDWLQSESPESLPRVRTGSASQGAGALTEATEEPAGEEGADGVGDGS